MAHGDGLSDQEEQAMKAAGQRELTAAEREALLNQANTPHGYQVADNSKTKDPSLLKQLVTPSPELGGASPAGAMSQADQERFLTYGERDLGSRVATDNAIENERARRAEMVAANPMAVAEAPEPQHVCASETGQLSPCETPQEAAHAAAMQKPSGHSVA